MSIVSVEVDMQRVLGWWLPRGGNTKLERLCICRARRRKSGVEWFVCLFVVLLLVAGGVHKMEMGVCRCEV
jgi:hypothetical protein